MSWFELPKIRKPKIPKAPKMPDDFQLDAEINVQPLRPPLPADPVAAMQGTPAASPTPPAKPKKPKKLTTPPFPG